MTDSPDRQSPKPRQEPQKPSFWQIVQSTLAAAIGVQSGKNRERDFTHGSIKAYLAAGLIFTTLFVLAVVSVVTLVLKFAT